MTEKLKEVPEEIIYSRYASFTKDLNDMLQHHEMWLNMAWQEIRLRYRRSKIGPFWITISTAFFIFTLGFMRGALSGSSIRSYLAHIAFGLISWQMMVGILSGAGDIYVINARYVTNLRLNLLVLIMKSIMTSMFIFAHDLIIFVLVVVFLKLPVSWNLLLMPPGLLLVVANMFMVSVIFSLIGVRYRDFAQIVNSLIRVLFFLTPVYWSPEEVSGKAALVATVNPFRYFIDLIRAPMLGQLPELNSWLVALALLLILTCLAAVSYRSKSTRVAFWI